MLASVDLSGSGILNEPVKIYYIYNDVIYVRVRHVRMNLDVSFVLNVKDT